MTEYERMVSLEDQIRQLAGDMMDTPGMRLEVLAEVGSDGRTTSRTIITIQGEAEPYIHTSYFNGESDLQWKHMHVRPEQFRPGRRPIGFDCEKKAAGKAAK